MVDPTTRGYPQFDDDSDSDLAAKFNALAQAVNDDVQGLLDTLLADSQWHTITNTNSGYNVGVAQYRVKFGLLVTRVSMTRKTGVVTLNETVFGLPAGTFPTSSTVYRIPFSSGSAGAGFLAIDPSSGAASVTGLVGTVSSSLVTSQVAIPLD